MAVSVASALMSSRLDCVNSCVSRLPTKHIARLQRVQHALARVVTLQSTRFSLLTSTNLLEQLYWLPIEWRIRFKLASSTYKAIGPTYRLAVRNLQLQAKFFWPSMTIEARGSPMPRGKPVSDSPTIFSLARG